MKIYEIFGMKGDEYSYGISSDFESMGAEWKGHFCGYSDLCPQLGTPDDCLYQSDKDLKYSGT